MDLDPSTQLSRQHYFIDRQIGEAIAAVGGYTRKRQHQNGRVDYIWGTGDAAVLLTTDEDGRVIDYCPERQPADVILDFFSGDRGRLVGHSLRAIKKTLGESHDQTLHDQAPALPDQGTDRDTWRMSIEVCSRNGICESVNIRTTAPEPAPAKPPEPPLATAPEPSLARTRSLFEKLLSLASPMATLYAAFFCSSLGLSSPALLLLAIPVLGVLSINVSGILYAFGRRTRARRWHHLFNMGELFLIIALNALIICGIVLLVLFNGMPGMPP